MAKLKWNPKALDPVVSDFEKHLLGVAFTMEREIKRSMVGGGIKGKSKNGKRGKSRFIASAPGQPPHRRTSRLVGSISTAWSAGKRRGAGQSQGSGGKAARAGDRLSQVRAKKGEFVVRVGTNVEYAPYLEFGTRKMKPRPYLRPVYNKYCASLNAILNTKAGGGTKP